MARALTVLQLLPALESGGVERSTLEIAAALVAAGHRSLVASAGGRLVGPLRDAGSEHVTLDLGRKSLRTLRHVHSLRRLLAQERPDIVHARSRLPAWVAQAALRGIADPPAFVTTVHGLNTPGRYSAVMTRGERVICVSATVRDYVREHYPAVDAARLRVIPRGIDPQAYPRGYAPDAAWRLRFAEEFPALQGGVLLSLPGRGTRLKGHADAIRLLAGLRAQRIDARLMFPGAIEAGRGAYLSELERLARSLDVHASVVFTEPRHDVREVMAISALVLQLSTKPEAFGRTAAEALSLGRPVLGYDHGGIGEILAQDYPVGRVAPGDAAALLARARQLIEAAPPSRYTGNTLAQMQQATLAVYAELRGD